MKPITALKTRNNQEAFIHFIIAVTFIFILFCMDEGANNTNWANDSGNWIAFLIYLVGIMFAQSIISIFLLAKYNGKNKILLTNLIGIPLGLMGLFWMLG